MKEWRESGQWPLSCYAPFVTEPCLEGMKQAILSELSSRFKHTTEQL